jgi:hypothetical protein
MKILNKSARLICFNTKKGRIDLVPGEITENKEFGALKGSDKIFDHYLENGDLKEVKATKKDGKKA